MEERQGPRRPCRTASCSPLHDLERLPALVQAGPGSGWPGNLDAGGRAWLQGGRGHLDRLGARATSTRAP